MRLGNTTSSSSQRHSVRESPIRRYCSLILLRSSIPVSANSLSKDAIAADKFPDHAVSASTVYLIRSMGTVWGVAITAAIVQTTLKMELPWRLGNIPHKAEARVPFIRTILKQLLIPLQTQVIDGIRHSVTTLRDLPSSIQLPARMAYYDGIRYAFIASTAFAALAFLSSLFANGKGLRQTSKR